MKRSDIICIILNIVFFSMLIYIRIHKLFTDNSLIGYFLISVFFLGGVFMAFIMPKMSQAKQQRCTDTVIGMIVDVRSTGGGGAGNERSYSPVFEYEYCGRRYVKESSFGLQQKPVVGSNVELKINPKNPSQFYAVEWDSSAGCTFKVLGYWFIGFTILPLIYLIVEHIK